MNTLRIPALLCSALALAVFTPSAEAGSLFASEGLGLPRDGYDIAARGTGGTSIGSVDPYQMSVNNPAAIGWVIRPQVQAGLVTENNWITTRDSDGSTRVGGTRLPGIRLAIPWPGSLRWGAGFRDLTDGRYTIESVFNEGADDEFTRTIHGAGSIGQLYAEFAVPIADVVSVGARFGWVGGTLREQSEDDFFDGDVTDTETVLRTRVENAKSAAFGIQARPVERVSVGAYFGQVSNARLKSLLENDSGVTSEQRRKYDYPSTWGIGGAFRMTKRWEVLADYSTTMWSDAEVLDDNTSTFNDFQDGVHIGIGVRRLSDPAATIRSRLSRRTVWRLGYRYDELGLPSPTGDPIKEWALTGGVGIPVQFDRGFVDGLVEFGRRGDKDEVGLRETFFRMGVGVTFQQLPPAF